MKILALQIVATRAPVTVCFWPALLRLATTPTRAPKTTSAKLVRALALLALAVVRIVLGATTRTLALPILVPTTLVPALHFPPRQLAAMTMPAPRAMAASTANARRARPRAATTPIRAQMTVVWLT